MTKKGIKKLLDESWNFNQITNIKEWRFHESHFCCSRCGGTNVYIRISVDPNTGHIMKESNKSTVGWCYDCDNVCLITTKSNFKEYLTPYEK